MNIVIMHHALEAEKQRKAQAAEGPRQLALQAMHEVAARHALENPRFDPARFAQALHYH